MKKIYSVLVENRSGVLCKVSGLFSRRSFNIDSLAVGETDDPTTSCMTIVSSGDERTLEQIEKQVAKLVDVRDIKELKPEKSVYRELALIKVKAKPDSRRQIVEATEIYKAKVVDLSPDTMILEITGDPNKIEAFIKVIKPYGILEMQRTGVTVLARGEHTLKDRAKNLD